MEPKKTFLRNILTTASSITIAAGFAYEAGAGGIIRDFAPAPGGVAVVGGTSPAGFVDGADGLRIIANGVIIVGNTAVDVRGIDLGASTASISIVTNDVSIGSILIGASLADIAVNGKKLTLTGQIPTTAPGNLTSNNYSGLGTVTLSNNASSEVDINTTAPIIFTNNFAVETNEVGTFKVLSGSSNNTFRGNIGVVGHAFGAIRILDDTLFQGSSMAVKAGGSDGITIANGKVLTINSTLNKITITGSIDGASTDNGSLIITGTGNDISLPTIGGNAALSNIIVSVAPGNSVTFNNNVTVTGNINAHVGVGSSMHFLGDVSLTGNTSTLTLGDDLSYSGNLKISSSGVDVAGAPTGYGMKLNGHDLTIKGSSTITGVLILGGTSSLILNGGNVILKGSTDNTDGNSINFKTDNILTIDASAGARYISGTFKSTLGTKAGTLEVTGNGGNITLAGSNVGSFIDNDSINKLHFASDATLILTGSGVAPVSGTIIYTPITTYQDGKGTIILNNNYTRFSKDIGAATAMLKEIHFTSGKFTVERALSIYAPITGAGNVELDNNLTLHGDAGDNTTPLTSIQLNFSTFTSDSSTAARNIYSPIITSVQHQGNIITKGGNNISFHGPIGNRAGNLTINSISTTANTGGTITFQDISAKTITTGARPVIFNGAITTDTNGTGTLTAGGNVTFKQNVGAPGDRLELITLNGGTDSYIDGATNIYSNTITQYNTLHSDVNDLTLHTNTGYNINNSTMIFGDHKTTVIGGNTALIGDIIINANYTTAGQVVLDLSGTTSVDGSAINSLTFNLTNPGNIVTSANDSVIMLKAPAGGLNIKGGVTPTLTSPAGWELSGTYGTLIYRSPSPSAPSGTSSTNILQNMTFLPYPPADATLEEVEAAVTRIASNFNGSISDNSDGTKIIDIFGGTPNTPDIVDAFIKNILNILDTPELREGAAGVIAQIKNSYPNAQLSKSTGLALAAIMNADGRLNSNLTSAVFNQNTSGISPELVQTIVSVASNGTEQAKQLFSMLNTSTNQASTVLLYTADSRMGFANIPISTSSLVPNQSAFMDNSSPKADMISASGKTESGTNTQRYDYSSLRKEEEINGDDLQAVSAGVASGSSPYDRFGIWGSINTGIGAQKQRSNIPGFNSVYHGLAIGVDTMINDKASVGLTLSHTRNDIKHSNNAAGNRTGVASWVGAIYGNRRLKNDWFIRGIGLFNKTHINNKELRTITNGFGIAQSKYNLISYGGEASIGFTRKFKNQIILTPTIGVRMLHNNKISYSQTGDTGQNNKISQNAMDNYSALAGLSVARTIVRSGIDFTPEVNANIQRGINTKSPQGSFVSPLNPNIRSDFIGTKPSKISANYGLSFTGSGERVECGISGTMSVADKYRGYTGALKLKVKF